MTQCRQILLNADFDLSLRPRWQAPKTPQWRRQVAELGLHALLLGAPEDSILLEAPPSATFVEAFQKHGFVLPSWALLPTIDRTARFEPFGWNQRAAELNSRFLQPTAHPPVEAVRSVNSRLFSAGLDASGAVIGAAASVGEVADQIAGSASSAADGWVVKSLHGNAALGNRRLRSSQLSGPDQRWLQGVFEQDDGVVVELWRRRELDLCATFHVSSRGLVEELSLHEMVNSADGAFIGALFEHTSSLLSPWLTTMEKAAEEVAGRLHREGYHGPVCLDAFLWGDGSSSKLRSVVDINARLHVSAPAMALWKRLGGRGAALWRFYSLAKLELPGDERALPSALGDSAFDRSRGSGTLLTSPMTGKHGPVFKMAVLHLACSRNEVLALDHSFRLRFERGFTGSVR